MTKGTNTGIKTYNDKGLEVVICKVCGGRYRKLTGSHIKMHGIPTIAAYLALYPGASYIASDIRAAEVKRLEENNPMHTEDGVANLKKVVTGVPKSAEHRKNISNARGHSGRRFGPHKESTKKKISNTLKGRFAGEKHPLFGVHRPVTKETILRREETKRQRRAAGVIYKTTKGKKLNLSSSQRENRSLKRCQYLRNNGTNKKNTDIELKFKKFLEENDITHDQQFILTSRGSWLYDFYIPDLNMLVELDGEYWHRTKSQINRDIIKDDVATRHGYNFVRISSKNLIFSIIFECDDLIKHHNTSIISGRRQRHANII